MISQDLFDETLLENQDVFEYTDDEAVKETINEFLQQQASQSSHNTQDRLEHLLLTHPNSQEGRNDRNRLSSFERSMGGDSPDLAISTSILMDLQGAESSNTDGNSRRTTNRTRLLSLWFLILQKHLWTTLIEKYHTSQDDLSEDKALFMNFVVALFPHSSISLHPLAHDLKRAMGPFWFKETGDIPSTSVWFRFLEECLDVDGASITSSLVRLARTLCNGCEDNKKSFVKASLLPSRNENQYGLQLLIECLEYKDGKRDSSVSCELLPEVCRLLTVLSQFQSSAETNHSISSTENPTTGGAPFVSSAHANVKEFHRARAVPRLHRIARVSLKALQDQPSKVQGDTHEQLLCESLAALRAMAIDNDIVQNMIALGILDTVRDALGVVLTFDTQEGDAFNMTTTLGLATATLGLIRNLCANDEVKTTICKSSLTSILRVMQYFLDDARVSQPDSSSRSSEPIRRTRIHSNLGEHACGILAAMALRQPQNAHAIVDEGGHVLIVQAMRTFPNKVTVQKQGCLALRNIASRLSRMSCDEDKTKLLDAGAEDVLQNIAGKLPGSAEEAYAALRDLGFNPQMFQSDEYGNITRSVTEVFGSVKSNFRPVYE